MTEEIAKRISEAASAEEIISIVKEAGKEVTAEQAQALYDRLHSAGELSDEDLENVAGGFRIKPIIDEIKSWLPF